MEQYIVVVKTEVGCIFMSPKIHMLKFYFQGCGSRRQSLWKFLGLISNVLPDGMGFLTEEALERLLHLCVN